MELTLPDYIADLVTDRCLRCYREQQWYGENFLFDFIGEKDVTGKRILEIGCAEAGLLQFYKRKGAICSGLELSDVRYNNALLLNEQQPLHLFQANICIPESYGTELTEKYDTIIIRDVIEHIEEKETALENMFKLLKPGGKLFMSFPPKYCAYAGHQQIVPKILGKLPFLHLLPNILYKGYLRLIGCPEKKISYLLSTKDTRISIHGMHRLVQSLGFNVTKETSWFIRPAYSFRFGLPKLKNPFSGIPIFNEIFSNGILFLLERPEK